MNIEEGTRRNVLKNKKAIKRPYTVQCAASFLKRNLLHWFCMVHEGKRGNRGHRGRQGTLWDTPAAVAVPGPSSPRKDFFGDETGRGYGVCACVSACVSVTLQTHQLRLPVPGACFWPRAREMLWRARVRACWRACVRACVVMWEGSGKVGQWSEGGLRSVTCIAMQPSATVCCNLPVGVLGAL